MRPSASTTATVVLPDGAPALPEVTRAIEALIAANGNAGSAAAKAGAEVKAIDPKPAYLARLNAEVKDHGRWHGLR